MLRGSLFLPIRCKEAREKGWAGGSERWEGGEGEEDVCPRRGLCRKRDFLLGNEAFFH